MEERRKEFYGIIKSSKVHLEDLSKILSDLYSYNVVESAILVYHYDDAKRESHIHFGIKFRSKRTKESVKRLGDFEILFYELDCSFLVHRKYLLDSPCINQSLVFEIGIR